MYAADLFNYALSANQVAELVDVGLVAGHRWANIYGCNAILNQERDATFAGSGTNWSAETASTGTATIDTTNDELDVVVAAAEEGAKLSSSHLTQITSGQRYRVTCTLRNIDTLTTVSLKWNAQTIGSMTANGDYEFEFTPTSGVGTLYATGDDAGSFSITNLFVTPALLANGGFETAGAGGADVFANWNESTAGTSSVNRDTSVYKVGAASCRFDVDASDSTVSINQTGVCSVGTRYRCGLWVRHNKGSALTALQFSNGGSSFSVTTDKDGAAINIPDETWTWVEFEFTASGTPFYIFRPAASVVSKSIWYDGVTLTPIGSIASFSSWGLDKDTTLWRNQAMTGDATINSTPQVVTGHGRLWADENMLTQISREHRALAGGGVYFDGNASQRVLCVDSVRTAQDIDTAAFWFRVRCTVPTSNPAAARFLFLATSSSSGSTGAAGFGMYVGSSGQLDVVAYGATPGSDSRTARVSDFVSRYAGKVVNIVLCRTSTGGVLLWINGAPQVFIEVAAGTPPTWALDVTSTYVFGPATHIGEVFTWQLGRGTLTDSLVAELTSTGLRNTTAGASPIDKAGKFSATAQDGCVIDLEFSVGVGQQFPDRSGNGLGLHGNSNHTTHSHLLPKRMGQVRGRTSTSGNQQLLGTVAIPPNARITSIVCTSSGSATVSIGNASGGAQIASGLSIVSGKNEVATFVARYSTTGNIWINSNAAETLDWTINFELVD